MKYVLFSILFLLNIPVSAQQPWSAPQLLCDSIADNINPTFVKGIQYSGLCSVVLWERDYGDRSVILMKDFVVPDSEIAITAAKVGIFSSKPTASIIDPYPAPSRFLIVWESNENENSDLYSVEFINGQTRAYQQITSDTGDDLNPDLIDFGLVWERDGSIYYSQYSSADSSWSPEIMLDSSGCSNPTISNWGDYQIAYQKRVGNKYKIYLRTRSSSGNWNPPQLLSPEGDNRIPQFSRGLPAILIWQHKDTSDWNIMSMIEWIETPTLFSFSSFDEEYPIALETPIITRDSFFAPLYFSFQSNLSGNRDIYANDISYDENSIRNISLHPEEDRYPILSEFSWSEATTYDARCWLAWEHFQNGKWQIWGSYAEAVLTGIDYLPGDKSSTFHLFQNYPNPFNPTTTISYRLAIGSKVELNIYNLLGQHIRTLVSTKQTAGTYQAEWDGKDDSGGEVGSGVYVIRLRTSDFVQSRKMILIR